MPGGSHRRRQRAPRRTRCDEGNLRFHLDTNVISEIFKPLQHPHVVAWLETVPDDIAMTANTLAELLAGLRRLRTGPR